MKPKEYVKKYRLDCADSVVSKDELLSDLSNDFIAMVEYLKGANQLNYTRFKTVVSDFWNKVESLKRQTKCSPTLLDEVRGIINSSIVKKVEQELFGDYLRKQKAKKDQERAYERSFFGGGFGGRNFFDDLFAEFFMQYMKKTLTPSESFERMGINSNAKEEDVMKQFRSLAMKAHPDHGGKQEDMVKLIEDKNKCLAFVRARVG